MAEDLKKIKEYITEDNEEMAVKTIQDITKIFLWCEEGDFMNKNLYSGKLIAVDGPNGAGKTTIIQELKKELEKRRIKACFTKEPTDNELGCFVREWIK